jgi:hypothetical protein
MSLAYGDLPVMPVKTSETNIQEPVDYQALIGSASNTYRVTSANSFSQTNCEFNLNPSNPNTVINRELLLETEVTVDFVGTAPAGRNLLVSGRDSFRSFPLHSVMQNLSLEINGMKTNIQPRLLIHQLMSYFGENTELNHISGSPCLMDEFQSYDQGLDTNRNVLADYAEKFGTPARGGFPYVSFVNGNTSAQVKAVLREPLVITPLIFGGNQAKGLCNVQTMRVSINWTSNLARMWSHLDDPNALPADQTQFSSINVTFGKPKILTKEISLPNTVNIPQSIQYRYQDMNQVFTTEGKQFASDETNVIDGSSMTLNVVPSHMLIFVKERPADLDQNSTDALFSIEELTNFNFANQSNFQNCSKYELYKIAKKNGVHKSWSSWCGEDMFKFVGPTATRQNGAGSLLVLKFGEDVAMQDSSVSVGTPGVYNLQLSVRCTNRNPNKAITPELYCVPIYDGVMDLTMNQAITSLSVLSQADVLEASVEAREDGAPSADDFEGGNMWGNLSRGFSRALPYIRGARKVGQIVSKAIPDPRAQAVGQVLDVAEQLGLGGVQYRKHRADEGAVSYHAKPEKKGPVGKGGVLVGGKMMSKAELRRRLME